MTEPFSNTSIGFLEPADFDANKKLTLSLKNPDTLYIIMVYANWCGPCKQTKPVYAELSRFLDKNKLDKIRLTAINTTGVLPSEKNWPTIAKDLLGVTGYPTILLVSKGNVIGKHSNSRDMAGFLKTLLDNKDHHSHGDIIETFYKKMTA